MAHPPPPPQGNHFTTTHTPKGSSIFLPFPTSQPKLIQSSSSYFTDLHVAPTIPVSLDPRSTTYDITATSYFIETNQHAAGMAPSGVVFRTISMPLGEETPMHKTLSVDYAVLIEGSVELILDAPYPPELEGTEENELGRKEERRVLNPGDTVVQRGTMHAWRNVGEGWARMVFVMMPAAGLDVQGLEGEVV